MISGPRFGCVLLSLLFGCAPTTLSTRTDREVVRAEKVVGRGHDRTITPLLREHEDGATLVLTSGETCDEQQVRVVRRREITEQKADVGNQVLLYLLAAAGVGLGATFVGDAHNIPAADDPTTRNVVGRTGAYALGGVTLSIGAVFLGLGIGTTARGRDLVNDLGETTEDDGPSRAIACNERPVAKALVALTVVGAAGKKSLGVTDADGRIEIRWKDLRAPLVDGAASTRGTIEIDGATDTASIDLAPARRYWAQHVLEESRALLAGGKTSEATERLREAELLGADIATQRGRLQAALADEEAQASRTRAEQLLAENDLIGAWSAVTKAEELGGEVALLKGRVGAARTTAGNQHIALAWKEVRRDHPDEARGEQWKAAALGVEDEKLADAIEKTPTVRRQKREEERKIAEAARQERERALRQQREEQEAQREQARQEKLAAAAAARQRAFAQRSESLITLCDLGVERTRDLQEIGANMAGDCGGSCMSPDAIHCCQAYERQKIVVSQRYEARMARFRDRAEKDLGRRLNGTDCCDALPSRYQLFGSNCVPYR